MSDLVATPSSDESSNQDARRKCNICKARMSSFKHDKHSLCVTCRGGDCSYGNKCQECLKWAKEEFDSYIKHRKALEAKSRHRKRLREAKDLKSSVKSSGTESERDPDPDSIVPSRPKVLVEGKGDVEVAKDTEGTLSKSEITNLISKVVGEFATQFRSEFAVSMSNAFEDIATGQRAS